jgi:putative transposase
MDQSTKDETVLKVRFLDVLTETLREGAQKMLIQTVQNEVEEYLACFADQFDEHGHRLVIRNGTARPRTILTGIGPMTIQMPRVHDKRIDEHGEPCRFTSKILPPYLRKTKRVEEFIPWLYLKGISTGDMAEALEALAGPQAAGLSATTVTRLKQQ